MPGIAAPLPVVRARQTAYSDSIDKTYAKHSRPTSPTVPGPWLPSPGDAGYLPGMAAAASVLTCGAFGHVSLCSECGEDGFGRRLDCGREWCSRCGAKRSDTHKQRMARWLPKVQQMAHMGYWVIEWPIASRTKLRSRKALAEAGRIARKAFQQIGYARGLRRWHYFGDHGAARGWNPHLNVLTDAASADARITKEELANAKDVLRKAFGEDDLIIRYEPRPDPRSIMHTLRYVTRATFRVIDWDAEMADEIQGFRTTDTWGGAERWKQPNAWDLEAREEVDIPAAARAVLAGRCPGCGGELHSKGIVRMADVQVAEDLGAGCFRLAGMPRQYIEPRRKRRERARAENRGKKHVQR